MYPTNLTPTANPQFSFAPGQSLNVGAPASTNTVSGLADSLNGLSFYNPASQAAGGGLGYFDPASHASDQLGGVQATGNTGGTGGTGGNTSVGGYANYNGYYDNLQNNAQAQIDRLGVQNTIGDQNINDAYNTSYNQLQSQKGIADRNYQTAKDQTINDNVLARGNIQAGVGQTANSLQRLLGAHGAGSSSAALYAAPYAAARTGAIQNNQVQQAFGRNQQALDTNYGDYGNQFDTSVKDLGHQRDTQKNALQSTIAQNRSSLLAQLANIAQQRAQAGGASASQIVAASQPFQDQINSLGGQIDQLGQQYANPVLSATAPVYKAPSLESYNYDQGPVASFNGRNTSGAPGATSAVSPFLSVLLSQQDKQKQAGV